MDLNALKYAKSHEWISAQGQTATVGITDFAVHQLTDLVHIELPRIGRTVRQGEAFGEVESVKAVSDLYAPIGRTHAPPFDDTTRVLAGRVLGEHVFTRPFAPPGQRRVTTLDFPGAPDFRETRPPPPSFDSIVRVASVAEGGKPLEPAPRIDPVPIVFGLVHTDGNMHVNSLAYLRVFEEAALRRFVELGRGSKVLCRHIDIAYRKPCFAGQTMRVVQQVFEDDGKLGVAAVLVDASAAEGADARPHVYARLTFDS